MPDSWIANECAGNMWLRGLRKRYWSLCVCVCVRTREAYSVTQFTGFNGENMKAFFENLFELI
jgi:hypothetical protein